MKEIVHEPWSQVRYLLTATTLGVVGGKEVIGIDLSLPGRHDEEVKTSI